MSSYSINGNLLKAPSDGVGLTAATAPTSHSVAPSQPNIVQTIGGQIMIEPPSGNLRVHTWQYDRRHAAVITLLKGYMGGNPLCVIDTVDDDGSQLTNLVVLGEITEIKSAERRDWVESFSVVWHELMAQS